ncbi:MAG: DUF4111 domain-containing protein, partial [Anaerolineae bacterium]|nr:DUF4111 domain-containing protein [Anaerolineae bacterium]
MTRRLLICGRVVWFNGTQMNADKRGLRAERPTAYDDVNAVLALLLERVREVLAERFVGLYVYGSLATGDFAPGRSDIDFVVVTDGALPDGVLPQLRAMHAAITASGRAWATVLEGPYIPQDALRRYDPDNARHPALRVDGSFDVDWHARDWIIQRYVIREQGIVVAGPAPETLIDPVTADDLRRVAVGIVRDWWEPMLERVYRLHEAEYQAYAVLTMCRTLVTLAQGAVVGKQAAAEWTKERVDPAWTSLIDQALAWREGLSLDEVEGVRSLIRYVVGRCDAFEQGA